MADWCRILKRLAGVGAPVRVGAPMLTVVQDQESSNEMLEVLAVGCWFRLFATVPGRCWRRLQGAVAAYIQQFADQVDEAGPPCTSKPVVEPDTIDAGDQDLTPLPVVRGVIR